MSPLDAAKLLEIAPDATPEQIQARFLELQAKLEDRIAKAPTPGLKVKYRESLAEITTAFETLALAADSSALPVLRRDAPTATGGQRTDDGGQKSATGLNSPSSAIRPPPSAKRSGGREFAIIAVIAVAVLGAGGWWAVNTRAENAEKERVATETKATAEQKAAQEKRQADEARVAKEAADKSEKDRQETLLTQLRTRMAELDVTFNAEMGTVQNADREFSELRSQERDLARDNKAEASPALRAVSAQVAAQAQLVNWMRERLPVHPAQLARVKAQELVSSRAADEAKVAVDGYAGAIVQLRSDLAAARRDFLTLTGSLKLSATPAGVGYSLQDAYGRVRRGQTPADLSDLPLGTTSVSFQRVGWPDVTQSVIVRRSETASASADLTGGALTIDSAPAQMSFLLEGQGRTERGRAPAKIEELPAGTYAVTFQREGWADVKQNVTVTKGATASARGEFSGGGEIRITSVPTGAEVWEAGRRLGTTPLTLTDRGPGSAAFDLRLSRHVSARASGTLGSSAQLDLSATLQPEPLTRQEAYTEFQRQAVGVWTRPGTLMQSMVYLRVRGTTVEMRGGKGLGSNVVTFEMVEFDQGNNTVWLQTRGTKEGTLKLSAGQLVWDASLWTAGTFSRGKDTDW